MRLEEAVVKKSLASIVLGVALLAVAGVANADQRRPEEPRWGIRPERASNPSPLDLARWLARRLLETAATVPVPIAPSADPYPVPGTDPAPVGTDEICVPERGHCPIG